MRITTRITGARDVLRRLRDLPRQAERARNEALEEWAGDLEDTAKRLVPKRTRRLHDQIEARVNRRSGTAYVGVWGSAREYAYYVEKGTSSMPDQPYLGPAAQIHRRTGERAMRRSGRRFLGGP